MNGMVRSTIPSKPVALANEKTWRIPFFLFFLGHCVLGGWGVEWMEREKVSHNQILIAILFVIWRWAAAIQYALAHQMTILWRCRCVTSINHLVVPYQVLFVFAVEFTSPHPPLVRTIGS